MTRAAGCLIVSISISAQGTSVAVGKPVGNSWVFFIIVVHSFKGVFIEKKLNLKLTGPIN